MRVTLEIKFTYFFHFRPCVTFQGTSASELSRRKPIQAHFLGALSVLVHAGSDYGASVFLIDYSSWLFNKALPDTEYLWGKKEPIGEYLYGTVKSDSTDKIRSWVTLQP